MLSAKKHMEVDIGVENADNYSWLLLSLAKSYYK